MALVWLASYPKSGNTWVRAFLTAYLGDGAVPDLNALAGAPAAASRERFDAWLGLSSSDMTPAEIARHLPAFHAALAEVAAGPETRLVKTHAAALGPDGPLFQAGHGARAIYIVRDPRDVAVSYAHHDATGLDRIVHRLADPGHMQDRWDDQISPGLPQPVGSWSAHVAGWLDCAALPVHRVRYEDLLASPEATFAGLLNAAGLVPDRCRLARAIRASRFESLKAQERAAPFRERQPTADGFFRVGIAGGWRGRLTAAQARAICEVHGEIMARLGYGDGDGDG